MTISIERLDPDALRAFDHLAPGVFDGTPRPDRIEAYLRQPGHMMILARDGGLVVGQCAAVLHYHPDKPAELYIDEVGTADAYLRRGIATEMVRAMLDWGRELGCEEAWLGTELDNVEANGLYRKLGGKCDHMHYYEFGLSSPR